MYNSQLNLCNSQLNLQCKCNGRNSDNVTATHISEFN